MKKGRGGKAGAKAKAKQTSQPEQLTGAVALRIKQVIDGGRQPDVPTLLGLLNSASPCVGLYDAACKGKGGNANCLCNLIPAPDKARKAGLWAKQPGALAALGPDPATLKREKPEQPVGLRNLGNTCYVNSVLQCLFANAAFRRAVYAARPPVAEHPAVKELRQLFVELEHGAVSPVDPGPLVGALQLDHGVQQDGQEFMKLLLTMLEQQFARQVDLREVIPSLFRGQSGYETVCQACGRPSESSSRSVNFYELDVPVKGFKSLGESLTSLLAPEFLCGDNQYSCEFCRGKADASRQLRLRALPPLLCLSLQRFVFDFNKMDRVKATDKFAFPLVLDMGPHLGQQAANAAPLLYDLVAILIHKGGSAMHGHYVAHINVDSERAGSTVVAGPGGWWRFDDEGVTRMKAGPCSSADHGGPGAKRPAAEEGGGSKGQKAGGRGRGRGGGGRGRGRGGGAKQPGRGRGKGKAQEDSDIEEVSDGEQEEQVKEEVDVDLTGGLEAAGAGGAGPSVSRGPAGGKLQPSEIVSQNAYLLVYRQRGVELAAAPLDGATQQWLAEARQRLATEYEQQCAAYAESKGGVAQRTQQRQEEVRAIVEAAVQLPEDDPGCYISTPWLQAWADADGSQPLDPIDNSTLLCCHGRLDPNKTQDMRRISTPAWEQLRAGYKGGPHLTPTDACPTCLSDKLAAVAASEDNLGQRDHYLALAAALEEGSAGEGGAADCYVAKAWLSNWQKRGGKSMGTTSPTEAITCPHGQLAPEQLGKQAKRVGVPQDFWGFLKRCWDAAVAERQRKQQKQAAGAKRTAAAASEDAEVVMLDSDGDIAAPAADPTSANGSAEAAAAAVGGDAAAGGDAAEAAAAAGQAGASPMLEFRCGCDECPVCLVELNEAARMAQGLRGRHQVEKAALAHLANSPPLTQPLPGRTYHLVPTSFMLRWRAYMGQAGRRAGAAATPGGVAQPPSLAECMAGVLCECHAGREPRLAYPAPAMGNKRGRWVVAEHEDGGLDTAAAAASGGGAGGGAGGQEGEESMWQLVESEDWEELVQIYGDGDEGLERGVLATLHISNDPPGTGGSGGAGGGGSSGSEPAAAAPAGQSSEAGGSSSIEPQEEEWEIGDDYRRRLKKSDRGGKFAWLEVVPPVCEATVAARREATRTARLTYTDQEVLVELVGSVEEAMAKPTQAPGAERKSKRARKGRFPLTVSSTDPLRTLRVRAYENLDVHPGNVRLFVRGQPLEREDSAMLAECEIFPGEEIKVVDTREYDPTDYASVVAFLGAEGAAGRGKGRPREAERGFTGTALHGLLLVEGEEGGTGEAEAGAGEGPGGGGAMAQG